MSNCTVERCTVETSDGVKLSAKLSNPEKKRSRRAALWWFWCTHTPSLAAAKAWRASLTGFAEIKDVIAVRKWVSENLSADMILLVGSSAGAPIAGSAVDQIEQVVGYVSLGYPFGMLASILFGRHHKAVLQSSKPKLFVMGTQDGFTSVKQLKNKLKLCSRSVETHLIEGASHFQMEGPAYDAQMELGWFTMCFRCQIKLLSQQIREKESR
ncbi:hypothetical protein ACFX2J_028537 [Malus domestica]